MKNMRNIKKVTKLRRYRDALTGALVGFSAGMLVGVLLIGVLLLYCRMAGPL